VTPDDAGPLDQTAWNPQPADCSSEVVRQILDYWQHKRRGRPMPSRADLDPLEMRRALGQIIMIEVHRDPLRFRTRLVGTDQASRRGIDLSGKWLDDLPQQYRDLVMPRAIAVTERAEPMYSRVRRMMDDRWYDYEAVWLPLAQDGAVPTMIMVVQEFFSG
jgi:hypothetical protein